MIKNRESDSVRELLQHIAVAALACAAIFVASVHTLQASIGDFMAVAWQPGQQILQRGWVETSYPYPLWTPLLMLPFTIWSAQTGAQLWLICNILLLGASCVGIGFLLKWPRRLAVSALASLAIMLYEPVFTSVWIGQMNILMLAALVLLLWALEQRRWKAVGAILGLFLIKPQVLALVVASVLAWLVWRRRWQSLASFGAIVFVLVGLAAPFVVAPRQIFGGGAGEHLVTYLGHTSTLWGLSLTALSSSWLLPASASLALLGWVLALWALLLRASGSNQRCGYVIAVTIVVNLMIVPYSWSYNHALLVWPFCYAIDRAWRLGGAARVAWLAALFGLIYPVSRLIYLTLTGPHHSDAYQIIPVVLFLPLLALLQRQFEHGWKPEDVPCARRDASEGWEHHRGNIIVGAHFDLGDRVQ